MPTPLVSLGKHSVVMTLIHPRLQDMPSEVLADITKHTVDASTVNLWQCGCRILNQKLRQGGVNIMSLQSAWIHRLPKVVYQLHELQVLQVRALRMPPISINLARLATALPQLQSLDLECANLPDLLRVSEPLCELFPRLTDLSLIVTVLPFIARSRRALMATGAAHALPWEIFRQLPPTLGRLQLTRVDLPHDAPIEPLLDHLPPDLHTFDYLDTSNRAPAIIRAVVTAARNMQSFYGKECHGWRFDQIACLPHTLTTLEISSNAVLIGGEYGNEVQLPPALRTLALSWNNRPTDVPASMAVWRAVPRSVTGLTMRDYTVHDDWARSIFSVSQWHDLLPPALKSLSMARLPVAWDDGVANSLENVWPATLQELRIDDQLGGQVEESSSFWHHLPCQLRALSVRLSKPRTLLPRLTHLRQLDNLSLNGTGSDCDFTVLPSLTELFHATGLLPNTTFPPTLCKYRLNTLQLMLGSELTSVITLLPPTLESCWLDGILLDSWTFNFSFPANLVVLNLGIVISKVYLYTKLEALMCKLPRTLQEFRLYCGHTIKIVSTSADHLINYMHVIQMSRLPPGLRVLETRGHYFGYAAFDCIMPHVRHLSIHTVNDCMRDQWLLQRFPNVEELNIHNVFELTDFNDEDMLKLMEADVFPSPLPK